MSWFGKIDHEPPTYVTSFKIMSDQIILVTSVGSTDIEDGAGFDGAYKMTPEQWQQYQDILKARESRSAPTDDGTDADRKAAYPNQDEILFLDSVKSNQQLMPTHYAVVTSFWGDYYSFEVALEPTPINQ